MVNERFVRTGLMQDLLTKGIDEQGRVRSEATHAFKDSPLGRVPLEWSVVKVSNLFEIQLGKMLSKVAKTGKRPYPYLANRNVQWRKVDVTSLETMDFNEEERRKFSLVKGDILICEGGEIGRTAIWQGEISDCYYQKAIHRLRAWNETITPEFMLVFMQMATLRGWLTNYTSQTSIAHLTQEKLAEVNIILPGLPEQRHTFKCKLEP
jgi:type I restriction enzyme, S subunit